jgi:DNA mismatch endonuclease (patch repair protein)
MPDNLTREQRSYTMSCIRSKDTTPETTIRSLVHARGLRFRKHKRDIPGRPDLVFVRAKIAVFIDGDFWHGWQFSRWRNKLAPYWRNKIEGNRRRDRNNFRRLRRRGWQVIRIWEHNVEREAESCVDLIETAFRLTVLS